MRILLIGYLIFIIIAALAVAYLISWLRIKVPKRVILIILIVIASPVIISYLLLSYFYPLSETMVPNLIGLSENEAFERLEEAGLSVHIEKKYESYDAVTYQRPEGGRLVKEGRTVSIILGNPKTINYLNPQTQEATAITPEATVLITNESTATGENTE
jgi:hypothetical protein